MPPCSVARAADLSVIFYCLRLTGDRKAFFCDILNQVFVEILFIYQVKHDTCASETITSNTFMHFYKHASACALSMYNNFLKFLLHLSKTNAYKTFLCLLIKHVLLLVHSLLLYISFM